MSTFGRSDSAAFEPIRTMEGSRSYRSQQMYSAHNRRQSSTSEDFMGTIDEDREQDFSDRQPFAKSGTIVTEAFFDQSPSDSSLLRRLTTRLRTGGSRSGPRPGQRRDYSNIQDTSNDMVGVDLSSLAGFGIELQESPHAHQSQRSPSRGQEDTAYRGASDSTSVPSFNDFRRRTLGKGMVIGAELKRDPSQSFPSPSANYASAREESLQRLRTIRLAATSLAAERGEMVAYSEGIDLSSIDASSMKHRQSTTFDDMASLNRATTVPDTKSYFFPPDPDIPNWRPFSMKPWYIMMLACIAFGLAGFQEYLCQRSLQKQREDPKTALLAFDSVDEVSVWKFFVWKYLPTGITISFAVLFSIMDFDIRRLEPYYQLSQPHGARAAASLNLDHLTMFQYFVPINAARLHQWTVFASTIANIIVATAAPALQNPSVNFERNPGCTLQPCDGGDSRCTNITCPDHKFKKFWVLIDPNWSRALTAAYGLVGLILLFIFWKLRRKSGLLSDPKGIAGIASMATKSHILQDFKGLDLATRGDIHRRLKHRTYVLHKSSIWQGEFTSNPDNHEFQDSEGRLDSPHPIMLQLKAGVPFIILMGICLVLVPIISLTPANIIPNAAPWAPIFVATVLKLIWSTFEADVRLMEPFYQLSKGHCAPRNSLTLDYQSTVYGWMPIRAALNGHYLVALVGLSSVFLDMLSVTIGSFSVDSAVFIKREHGSSDLGSPKERPSASEDQTYISFWVSLCLSLFFLLFAICSASLVYWKRRHPFLPREPSTIASVLSFIYSSNMLTDFIDTERLDNKSMQMKLEKLEKTYGLGWFKGRDGKPHVAIDEEPMLSKYIHGVPYSQAVSGPLQPAETFYSMS